MYRNKAILAGAPGLAISVVRLEELDSTEHWKHTNYLKHCQANLETYLVTEGKIIFD